jgi:hypothetical protein
MWTYGKVGLDAVCRNIKIGDVLTANNVASKFFPGEEISGSIIELYCYYANSLPYCCMASKQGGIKYFPHLLIPAVGKDKIDMYKKKYQGTMFNNVCHECSCCDISKTTEYGWETRKNICMMLPHKSQLSLYNSYNIPNNVWGRTSTYVEDDKMNGRIREILSIRCDDRRYLGNTKQKNCKAPKTSKTVYRYIVNRQDKVTWVDSNKYMEEYGGSCWMAPDKVVLLDGTTVCSQCDYYDGEQVNVDVR